MNTGAKKKLIEVALPLEAINAASAKEKSIRHGHPSTLHLWWARRPLAACRAVLFAQLVDDPSAHPERFPTEADQERERKRLFAIIEDLVKWENTTNETVLERARAEIRASCGDDPPPVYDPFCGGGSIPLEAQRLGLEAYASDLNPVAVLITKALVGIPPKFAGMRPVNPESRGWGIGDRDWGAGDEGDRGADGADQELPGPQGLAGSNDAGGCGVRVDADDAEGGGVPAGRSVDPGLGVGSGEHRRGSREGDAEGLRALHQHRPGLPGGNRNVPAAGGTAGPGAGGGDGGDPGSGSAGRAHAHAAAPTPRLARSPRTQPLIPRTYKGAQGLAEDVRYYGKWMRDEAFRRIGHLYPKATLANGSKATVIAWLWARTVVCPNPACGAALPLVSSYALSTKTGKAVWVEPVVERTATPPRVRFTIKSGQGAPPEPTKQGRGATFKCPCCGTLATDKHVKAEGKAGRMGAQLMAVVAEGARGRIYLPPSEEMEDVARAVDQDRVREARNSFLSGATPERLTGGTCFGYGLTSWGALFTPRQLVALTTFSDLVLEARAKVLADALGAVGDGDWGVGDGGWVLGDRDKGSASGGGAGPAAYADAIATYLGFALDKAADRNSSLCAWETRMDRMRNTFGRQALPMVWDYTETNPLSGAGGDIAGTALAVSEVLDKLENQIPVPVLLQDAASGRKEGAYLFATDPPYYNNIGYADLSDFFYVWLRRSLKDVYPELFGTMLVPKAQELVATPYRHGGKEKAEAFFMEGMRKVMANMAHAAHPDYPLTLYYAFKQAEAEREGVASTGWATFLDALVGAGFAIDGTWPVRTELGNRMIGSGTSALASSIVLVCRKREAAAPATTRSAFLRALRAELPVRLKLLQQGNIAPVDMAQASIGPGMSIFTRYARVLEANDTAMTVKTALQLINQALDEYLSEQEAEYDADTRFAITWFDSYGMETGPAGQANVLANARNVSVAGVAGSGILALKGDKVRLLARSELPEGWDPGKDPRLTVWECTQHLIRVLQSGSGGETAAAALLARLAAKAEPARDLAYRLYGICERRKWAEEAIAYNGLVVAWPELARLAAQGSAKAAPQGEMSV